MNELRIAKVHRVTRESDVEVEINLDGDGAYEVSTGIAFLDHMLESFAKHGVYDLRVVARGIPTSLLGEFQDGLRAVFGDRRLWIPVLSVAVRSSMPIA